MRWGSLRFWCDWIITLQNISRAGKHELSGEEEEEGGKTPEQQDLIGNAKLKYSRLKRLNVPRCNVSYRLIGGRVSQCQAPLTFSRLTMEGTCRIALRRCAGNSWSQRRLARLFLLPLFLGRNRNRSSGVLAVTRVVDCKCKGDWSPITPTHNHTCRHTENSLAP